GSQARGAVELATGYRKPDFILHTFRTPAGFFQKSRCPRADTGIAIAQRLSDGLMDFLGAIVSQVTHGCPPHFGMGIVDSAQLKFLRLGMSDTAKSYQCRLPYLVIFVSSGQS